MTQASVPPAAAAALPLQPFFTSPEQRVSLARERFFEGGERPTGLVSEVVLQSWSRCRGTRRDPHWGLAFDPVSRSRLHATLERNRALLAAGAAEIAQLEAALAGTGCRVLLTDANGVILHATPSHNDALEPVMKRAARRGVSLAEDVVGTNAPAVVVKTGEPVTVLGAEHYFDCIRTLRCAAAPIRDAGGRLAGVLDLTVEARPFAFDAAALVGVYATMIENRLLEATAHQQLVLAFQVAPGLIGSPLQALVGLDGDGRVAWHNGTALRLLGLRGNERPEAEQVLGLPAAALMSALLAGGGESRDAREMTLPNGLRVWMRARLQARDGRVGGLPAVAAPEPLPAVGPAAAGAAATSPAADAVEPAPAAPVASASTLSATTRDVIERTIAECGGNLSLAARRLGVSRGLLYRRRAAGG